MSLAGSWSGEYRREDRLLPVCQEIEQDLRLRLPAEEAYDAFWRLVDSFRKTLVQEDYHYRRNSALFALYRSTAYGLPPEYIGRFRDLTEMQSDFSELDRRRKPDIIAFWHGFSHQTLSRDLTGSEQWIIRRAGLPGVFAACLICADNTFRAFPGQGGLGEVDWGPKLGIVHVPTSDVKVEAMLSSAKTQPGELVMDLGSGDGRVLLCAAEKFAAYAKGVEFNPFLLQLSRWRVEQRGLQERVQIQWADIFSADISDADVITFYLSQGLMRALSDKLLAEVKPGARLISNSFLFPESLGERATITMIDYAPDMTFGTMGGGACLAQF